MDRKKKIKILYFIPTLDVGGGAEKMLYELVMNLDPETFEPIVWCTLGCGYYGNKLKDNRIQVMQRSFKKNRFDILGLIETIMILRKEKVDIIHSHLFKWSFWDALIGKLAGVPIIITSRHDLRYLNEGKLSMWYDKIRNYLTDRIIACSIAVKEAVIKNESTLPNKIKVIYNGIDFKNIPKEIDTITTKKELGLKPADNIIGSIGRLRTVKGFQYFLKAAHIIMKNVSNVKFIIVGQGGEEKRLKLMAKNLGLREYITFTGLRTDIFEILATFDIFVLPSLSEALPGVALEAGAMGKPVVATQCGGSSEIIEDGRTGYLVPSADENSLANAIIKLLKDKKRAIKFGKAGRDLVRKKFALEKMIKEYAELYKSLHNNV